MAVSTVTVQVPATIANLGPGFDCLGVAVTLYNQFQFQFQQQNASAETVEITVSGEQAEAVNTHSDNLVYRSFVNFYEYFGQTPPAVKIHIELNIPLSRGLGSSATAIIGGLLAANALARNPLDSQELLQLAIAQEGHPDNIVPAYMGGCRLAIANNKQWEVCDIPWHEELIPVVAIPNFEVSTQQARSVLPSQITRDAAIFNASHLGLLLRALETGRGNWLRLGMQDQLHQPYRQQLIPNYTQLESAALSAGAYGVAISGAGPTLVAITSVADAQTVAQEMETTWERAGITAQVKPLKVSRTGATVQTK